MRYYHLQRLQLVAMIFLFLGSFWVMVAIGLDRMDVFEVEAKAIYLVWGTPSLVAGVGILMIMASHIWLYLKVGTAGAGPLGPEGLPVDPTGVWIRDDTPLPPGAIVLAMSQGRWHRGVVVNLNSDGDRVLIHYLGWDPFWDEIHPRKKLQCCADELSAPPLAKRNETAIIEAPSD